AEQAQSDLAPACGEAARALFDQNRVHARPGPFKSPVSCSLAVDGSAFILLSFRDDEAGALALAHEIGHGVHQTLSAARGEPSRALAETAAALAELRVLDRLDALGRDTW